MSGVDLSALRMEDRGPVRAPRGPRIALGAVAMLALGLAATFLVPLLRPKRAVRVAPVVAAQGDGPARVALAEAAGWVEPEPFAVVVRPLVDGVLRELLVLEGAPVKAGETVVARLESAELLAARDRALARRGQAEATHLAAQADLAVAEALLDQKADLRAAEAAARKDVAVVRARLAAGRSARDAAAAALEARRADLRAQEVLEQQGGTYPVALARARAAVKEAEARLAEAGAQIAALEAEEREDAALLAIAEEVRADPRALAGDVAKARAAERAAAADAEAARVELAVAERELGWAEVRAPVDGVVMKLLTEPGMRAGADGEGIVSLYDPKRLQARIDVPLASVGGVREGQEAEVRSEVLSGGSAKAVVLRVQRESDLLKNTLQVKVRLLDPDPILRPETLVRARFLAPAGEAAGPVELFRVPKEAVRSGAVFVLHPQGARRVAVETVAEANGDAVVKGALSLAHRVILDAVEDGERVEAER